MPTDNFKDSPELDSSFQDELRSLLNKHSKETSSDTPDFILADYLNNCLKTFDDSVKFRDRWYKQNE